ncbi:MAG: RNA polymerase sigma factor [Pirellula sp.]
MTSLKTNIQNEPDANAAELCWENAPDEELLELIHRSRSRDAMAQMVERYAPMVASVVARHLRNPTSREEAFQATFLVLFQSANKIRKKTSLASFLFGVALRVSKRLRTQETQNTKRLSNQENQNVNSIPENKSIDPFEMLAKRLQTSVLDEEIELLPETLRAPLVDHYFAGKSTPEIANAMNLSVSAVEGRIKRGKQRLRSRLAYRGVSLTACLVAVQSHPSGVSASELKNWSESVLQHGSDPNFFHASPFNSDSNQTLRKLVQGELQMKSFTSPPWLFWSGSVCLITIVGLGMLQVSNGGPPTDQSQNRGTIIASDVNTALDETPLLQTGGMGGMGMSMSMGGMGGGMAGMSGGLSTVTEVVEWKNESTNAPKWLASPPGNEDDAVLREISAKLNERIQLTLAGVPISEFASKISEILELDVIVDVKALEDAGIQLDEIVTIERVRAARAKDILKQVLDPLACTYAIKYDALVITTKEGSSSEILGYYDLSYILPDNSTIPDLLESIQTSVTPDAWESNSGTGSMTILGSMLIVRAPLETHEGIEELLRQISKQSKDNLKPYKTSGPLNSGGAVGGMGGGMGGMGGGGMGGMGGGGGGMM